MAPWWWFRERAGAAPKLKARLMATGQQGTFGENGERITAEMENTPSNSRELLARVDFDPGSDAGMESMLGFRQELGFAGSVQTVAAVAIHPEVEGAGAEGLDEAAMRTSETLHLGDEFEGEVGSEQLVARFAAKSPNTVVAALPYVTAGWRNGNSTVQYRMTTIVPGARVDGESEAVGMAARSFRAERPPGPGAGIAPGDRLGAQDRRLRRCISGLCRPYGPSRARSDDAHGCRQAMHSLAGDALIDGSAHLIRAAGPDFFTTGVMATVDHRLPGDNEIRVSFANGDALVMPAVRPALCPSMRCWLRPVPAAQPCTPSRFPERSTGPGPAGARVIAGNPKRR